MWVWLAGNSAGVGGQSSFYSPLFLLRVLFLITIMQAHEETCPANSTQSAAIQVKCGRHDFHVHCTYVRLMPVDLGSKICFQSFIHYLVTQ